MIKQTRKFATWYDDYFFIMLRLFLNTSDVAVRNSTVGESKKNHLILSHIKNEFIKGTEAIRS